MARSLPYKFILSLCAIGLSFTGFSEATAQVQRRALTLRADMQQANAKTGVVTANGNVQLNYPARKIQATANAAQYYSRERRIVLSGNVYVLQDGNSLKADTITYLVDEGRFVAMPLDRRQVEATLLIPDDDTPVTNN
ncbi:LptA/OstA family protein [Altericista sp. CCNU0014]|uniref:LptA/OstA family protein n=1 Tax=Altericista sp. CCNU0014 TaxID=3082949 RepID=UPI00384FA228